MALERLDESDEDYHSMSGNEPEDGEDDVQSTVSDEPPVHPVPVMQCAFEESIRESAEDEEAEKTPIAARPTAEARRADLLERETYDDSWTTRWKQRPSAKHHPLMKLMAQIVFGMHLLNQQQAKSNMEVVRILQTHVDEVDGFLEKTTEDFDLAIKDIDERVRFLRLPMTHLDVFDIMLDDRQFRTQLVEGNEKIEQIVQRTAKAMNAATMDVEKGIDATLELGRYLDNAQDHWPHGDEDLGAIFSAMRGNEEGWLTCLRELQMKSNKLGVALVQLGTVIGEMDKLAAAASRRNMAPSPPVRGPSPAAPTTPPTPRPSQSQNRPTKFQSPATRSQTPRPFSSSSARPDSTVLPSNYAMPFKVRGTVPLNLPISQEKRASMLPWSEQQSQASPGATNDSAYASGSEPAAPHDASDAAALSPDGSETVTKPSSRMRLFPDTTDARPSSPYPPSASGRSKSSGERKGASLTPPTSEAPPSTGW
ncbi:hypothetical protein H2203_007481 [Taxawa tesnikishii (nom. ined.)]|nr:hypothetical protein H2203_007481 [Dothideales sp. JES 119]